MINMCAFSSEGHRFTIFHISGWRESECVWVAAASLLLFRANRRNLIFSQTVIRYRAVWNAFWHSHKNGIG